MKNKDRTIFRMRKRTLESAIVVFFCRNNLTGLGLGLGCCDSVLTLASETQKSDLKVLDLTKTLGFTGNKIHFITTLTDKIHYPLDTHNCCGAFLASFVMLGGLA